MNSSTTFIKLDANEAGPYGNGKNRITLSVPQGDVYNFKNSYIDVLAQLTAVDDEVGTDGVYNLGVDLDNTNETPMRNAELVRDVRVETRNKGIIEEIRNVNGLVMNLDALTRNFDDELSNKYKDISSVSSEFLGYGSVNNELVKAISGVSQAEETPIRMYLSDLHLGVGSESMYDTRFTGETKFTLNLIDLNNLLITENTIISQSDSFVPTMSNVSVEDAQNNVITMEALHFTDELGNEEEIPLNDIQNVPFYNNMKVELTGTSNGGTEGDRTLITTIKSVELSSDELGNGLVKLILNDDLPDNSNAAAYPMSGVSLYQKEFIGTPSLSLNQAELVLEQYNQTPENVVESMEFSTFESESKTFANAKVIQETFHIPPNCQNLMITLPVSDANQKSFMPVDTRYVVSVDNDRTTNKDVIVGDAVYKDKKLQTMLNMGYKVHNLSDYMVSINPASINGDRYNEGDNKNGVILEYLGTTERAMVGEVRVDSTNEEVAIYDRMTVYKQITKSL